MSAAGVVAQDAEVWAIELEDVDEGVPHVERGEEGVAEGDCGRCWRGITFQAIGNGERVWSGDV